MALQWDGARCRSVDHQVGWMCILKWGRMALVQKGRHALSAAVEQSFMQSADKDLMMPAASLKTAVWQRSANESSRMTKRGSVWTENSVLSIGYVPNMKSVRITLRSLNVISAILLTYFTVPRQFSIKFWEKIENCVAICRRPGGGITHDGEWQVRATRVCASTREGCERLKLLENK